MTNSNKTADVKTPVPVVYTPDEAAQIALTPSFNAAIVVQGMQGNLMGKDTGLGGLVTGLAATFKEVKAGDLHTMEAMLVAQATALQTIFASLARKAAHQEGLRQYEAFMGLALKAQSQSRATISALVDLKHPRQAMFVRQTNVTNGPQQVNNGTSATPGDSLARAEHSKPGPNKLLESDHGQVGNRLDTGAQTAPARSNPAVEAMAEIHRTDQR